MPERRHFYDFRKVTLGDLIGVFWFLSLVVLIFLAEVPLFGAKEFAWSAKWIEAFVGALAANIALLWLRKRIG